MSRCSFPQTGLATRQGASAIQNASIEVREGEALAIVGGSGSGKSTLGRAIAGIGPITSGTIMWKGEPLPERRNRTREMRAMIQPVFQGPVASLDPQWKVVDIIAEPLINLRRDILKEDRLARVQQALEGCWSGRRISGSQSCQPLRRPGAARCYCACDDCRTENAGAG